jgi:aspartyl-tRNA(Asn)/glutamyl-tRNA(Gln) amidotransferase subunit A
MMWTAREVRDAVATRALSAVEVCRACLDRIDRLDPSLHAFLTVTADRALARAAAIDGQRLSIASPAPLLGVPVAIKDNICTQGVRTTAGSRMLKEFVPPYQATVVERLERAGAVVLGKTTCDEFAMGSSTEHSAFGPSRNPWAVDRTPGGSSGGSAVAVAARMVPVALGSDTGGSVRQPAAFCGVVGLKPTYGRVSRYGLIAFASSLDQVGPFGLTAFDLALLLSVVAGFDAADATSARRESEDFTDALTGNLAGLRLGVPRRLLEAGVDEEVEARVNGALDVLRARGATVEDVELPHASHGIAAYYLVATAEASSNLARYDGVRYGLRADTEGARGDLRTMYEQTRAVGFGSEVKRRVMLGTYVLSAGYYDAYYVKAQQARALIRRDYDSAFDRVDAVVTPTSPTPAFPLGERVDDPLQMYLADVFTVGASLAGLPALSVPCGFTRERLPVGLHLVGRAFDEAMLLRLGDAYQRDTSWHDEAPPLPGVVARVT